MLLRLEYQGKTLYESDDSALPADLVIGRGSRCQWVVPGDVASVSKRHASIVRENDRLCLKDLDSRNGVFFKGERITTRELRPGDSLLVGDCLLTVERSRPGEGAKPLPRLIAQTGSSKGLTTVLGGKALTVGSDPKSTLPIADPIVSRLHAELQAEADGVWRVKDLESTNGTSVNGNRLRPGEWHTLKAGDRLYFAHVGFVFDDGSVVKRNTRVWRIAAGATAALLLLLVGARVSNPPAERRLAKARQLAATAHFEDAGKAVEGAKSARRAKAQRAEIETLEAELAVWRETHGAWTALQQAIGAGDWKKAGELVPRLPADKPAAWNWNPADPGLPGRARDVAQLLRALQDAQNLLERGRRDYKEARGVADALAAAAKPVAQHKAAYAEPLARQVKAVGEKLESRLVENRWLTSVDRLTEWPLPTGAVLEELLKDDPTRPREVDDRAHALLEPVRALDEAMGRCRQAAEALRELKLEEYRKIEPRIPAPLLCALDSRVKQAREALVKFVAELEEVAHLLETVLKTSQPGGPAAPACLLAWRDERAMERVFRCDTFQEPYPAGVRKTRVGDYDRYLGLGEFHRYLIQTSGQMNLRPAAERLEPPLLTAAVAFLAAARELTAFAAAHRDALWQGGRVAQTLEHCRDHLSWRDSFVKRLVEDLGQTKGREAMIEAGIALQLAQNPATLTLREQPLQDWLARQFLDLQAWLEAQKEAYGNADAAARQALDREILLRGVPGEAAANDAWKRKSG